MLAMETGLSGGRGAGKSNSPGGPPWRRASSSVAIGPQYRPWQRPIPSRVSRFTEPMLSAPFSRASSNSA